jgi:methyl-accepting chemotaxis protein-1 (serine sensor receptor)
MGLTSLTVRAKLLAAFATLLAFLVLVSALAVWDMAQMSRDFRWFVSDVGSRADMVLALRGAANARAIAARNLVLVSRTHTLACRQR